MIPAAFEYEVAESVDHAVGLLGEHEDAKLLAGGHSLLPLMRLRFSRPATLVDLGRVEELRFVRDAGDRIAIGAMTRHRDLRQDPLLQEYCPLLAHAAGTIGDPSVRNRGTIGGSLAHADPAADLPTVLFALEAEVTVRGPAGERTLPVAELVRGVFDTALGAADVLTEIRVPKTTGGWSYLKFNRRAQDWATVAVAALVERTNGSIGSAAVALASIGPTPVRARATEEALLAGGPDAVAEAAELAAVGADPPSDVAASAEFRGHLARVLTRRALEEALG
jgi:carbon-monoxide dehydrogenase medium subunit